MSSTLIITAVENLQEEVNRAVGSLDSLIGVYVSLNKTHKSIEKSLRQSRVKTDKLFFIDCVNSQLGDKDVIYISPTNLEKLSSAIKEFISEIPGRKFLIIDALSTFLIYNDENKVAKFVKEIIEYSAEKEVEVIALSPKTKGEELLDKIFNFFDKVKKTK